MNERFSVVVDNSVTFISFSSCHNKTVHSFLIIMYVNQTHVNDVNEIVFIPFTQLPNTDVFFGKLFLTQNDRSCL